MKNKNHITRLKNNFYRNSTIMDQRRRHPQIRERKRNLSKMNLIRELFTMRIFQELVRLNMHNMQWMLI